MDKTRWAQIRQSVESSLGRLFGSETRLTGSEPVGQGRGFFSDLWRVTLETDRPDAPLSIVVKVAKPGVSSQGNGAKSFDEVEAGIYERFLSISTTRTPLFHGSSRLDDGTLLLLIEDLSAHSWMDQLDGCGVQPTLRVASMLSRFHAEWRVGAGVGRSGTAVEALEVRPLCGLDESRLLTGRERIESYWAQWLDDGVLLTYRRLWGRWQDLASRYDGLPADTLIHGDARLDNMAFTDSSVIAVDWQQATRGPAAADLAWFLATSVRSSQRLEAGQAALEVYRQTGGSEILPGELADAMIRPGLFSTLLAGLEPSEPRAHDLVISSLNRIGSALVQFESLE